MLDVKKRKKLLFVQKIRSNLAFFSGKCLIIVTKEATIEHLIFNRAQKYVHKRFEAQLREIGMVRALVLKGRQQGISTYVGARFYHKSSLWKSIKVYILAHEQSASDALFDMVDLYQDNNPLAPRKGKSNAKELEFKKLGSSYIVATAGQKAGGRSRMSRLFHGSEVGFWANAEDHFSSSVQTVPDKPGTEIILESTANGPSGEFYERWQDAEAGVGDYMAVFVPWYWQEEYYREPGLDFELEATAPKGYMPEEEYAELFNLNLGQMAWRRAKIAELRSADKFDQEYPATAQMAFVNSAVKSYISNLHVLRARKRTVECAGPLIMGADPAGPGGDRFAIAGRRGLGIEFLEWRNKIETAEAYHWCKDTILELEPARFNIDAGGIGASVLSLLKNDEDIPKGVVRGVNFGGKSQAKLANPKKPGPKNRRAEMWMRMKYCIEGEEDFSIPDLDVLQADLTAPQLKKTLTNDILLESKEEMRERKIRSPDLADAIALTFASTTYISSFVDKKKLKLQYGDVDKRAALEKPAYVGGRNSWMG